MQGWLLLGGLGILVGVIAIGALALIARTESCRSSDGFGCGPGQGSAALRPMVLLGVAARDLPARVLSALPITEPDGAGPIQYARE